MPRQEPKYDSATTRQVELRDSAACAASQLLVEHHSLPFSERRVIRPELSAPGAKGFTNGNPWQR